MSRSPAGVYTLPAGNPVSTGQVISSTLWNETFGDLAAEITKSLGTEGAAAMTEPLRLDDGTAANPGLTFDSEQHSGLYREATNDVRMVIDGTPMMHWTANGVVMPAGVSIAQTLTDEAGLSVTGNGTGSGLEATGGTTSGAGLIATGGAANGNGAVLTGTGTGAGAVVTGGATSGRAITATGGAPNGVAIYATGDGTGAAINATGGDTSGTGLIATGGAPNGTAITAAAAGDGHAITATNSGSEDTIVATGGTGSAIKATSGGSGSSAVVATGVSGGKGLRVNSSATNVDVAAVDGYLNMSGATNPSAGTGFTSTLTPSNIIKAWARITTNGTATPALDAGFNVTGVTASSTTMTVPFVNSLVLNSYAAVVTCNSNGTSVTVPTVTATGAGAIGVKMVKFLTGAVTPAGGFTNIQTDSGTIFHVIVTGNQ